jgi:hypothetical protein
VINTGAGADMTITESAITRADDIAINPGAAKSVTTNGSLSVAVDASVTGNTSLTGNLTVGGNTSLGNSATDQTTITGVTSVTGTTSINTTGTANTDIGNGTGTFSLTSPGLNISTAGVISDAGGAVEITDDLTVVGTTTINATGTSNTTIGNTGAGTTSVTLNAGTNGDIVFGGVDTDAAPTYMLTITDPANAVRKTLMTGTADEGLQYSSGSYRLGNATDGSTPITSARFVRMGTGGSLTFNTATHTMLSLPVSGNVGLSTTGTGTTTIGSATAGNITAQSNGTVLLKNGAREVSVNGGNISLEQVGSTTTQSVIVGANDLSLGLSNGDATVVSNLVFDKTTPSAAFTVTGGGVTNTVTFAPTKSTLSKYVEITDASSATSTTTGALRVTGGVGIAENLWVGGTSNIAGATTLQSSLTVTGASALNGTVTLGNGDADAITVNSTSGLVINTGAGADMTITESAITRADDIAINPGAAKSVTTNGSLSVAVDASVTGNTSLTGNLTVGGNTSLGNSSTDQTTVTGVTSVTGTTTINTTGTANTTIGNTGTGTTTVTINAGTTGDIVLGGVDTDASPTYMLTITDPANAVRKTLMSGTANQGVIYTSGQYLLGGTTNTEVPFQTNRFINLNASNLSFTANGGANTPVAITGGASSGVALTSNGTGDVTLTSADDITATASDVLALASVTTNINTGSGNVNLGSATATNTILGTTNINVAGSQSTSIGNATGTLTLTGATTLAGSLNQTGAGQVTFSGNVDATNGLDVTNADLTVGGSKFTVDDATGNTDIAGYLKVNTNKFTVVAASGNTVIAGTLDVDGAGEFNSTLGADGNFRVGSAGASNFTVAAATGNTSVGGTLSVTGDVAVNTNKFTVTAASGNTSIAGTLNVDGATTLNSAATLTNASALKFNEPTADGAHYTSFKAGTQAVNLEYTLPTAAPTATNKVLTATTIVNPMTLAWTNPNDEVVYGVNTPTQWTTSQNNVAVPAASTVLRISSSTNVDMTGLSNTDIPMGRIIVLVNVGTSNITLKNNSGSSSAGNKFKLPGGADITLAQDGSVTLMYDTTSAVWRVLSVN